MVPELPQLERLCPECNGDGGERDGGEWSRCHRCKGAGYVPTESGLRVLELVRHSFGLIQREAEAG